MLEDALAYPLRTDDRVATLIVGGALILASVFVLPAFVLQGYLLRVLRSAATGERAAPSFTDWGELFVDGLKLVVVQAVYGVVIAVPVVAAVVALLVGGATGSDAGIAAFGAVSLLLLLLATLLSVAVAYVLPAAMTNFALAGEVGAAFDAKALREAALSGRYLVGVLFGVVLAGVIGSVASPFALILIGIPALFYGQVVAYYCFGRGVAEATGVGTVAEDPGPHGNTDAAEDPDASEDADAAEDPDASDPTRTDTL
ncbi:DUF4013 domain-containing protein [Halobaculum gomorrense]|uniref:Membrane domain of glycerophosphoryl diester phosphodiesterase n=1 Tax=Halobaculum gomorrense TaxID=43928 RepID=A0A1M5V6G3_9EURY|nr:DUF4013 domain-containing protein [Halobaculum gomorrense]SHH70513.1 Protein of unknown function [Halobaculum gomorrense]